MHAKDRKRFVVREGRPGTGKGLYARVPIKKGEFILEYTGKRLPTKIANEMDSRYLFEIDRPGAREYRRLHQSCVHPQRGSGD